MQISSFFKSLTFQAGRTSSVQKLQFLCAEFQKYLGTSFLCAPVLTCLTLSQTCILTEKWEWEAAHLILAWVCIYVQFRP